MAISYGTSDVNPNVKVVAEFVLEEIRKRGQDGMPSEDLLHYAQQVIDTVDLQHVYDDEVLRHLMVGEFITLDYESKVYVPSDENMELLLGCVEDEIKKSSKEGMGIMDAGRYILKTRKELKIDVDPTHVLEVLGKRGVIRDVLRDQKTVYVHADVAQSYY